MVHFDTMILSELLKAASDDHREQVQGVCLDKHNNAQQTFSLLLSVAELALLFAASCLRAGSRPWVIVGIAQRQS
jgi:hypothetical protein